MAAYRRVYDARHLQADCQEPGSGVRNPTLGNLVWADFLQSTYINFVAVSSKAQSKLNSWHHIRFHFFVKKQGVSVSKT